MIGESCRVGPRSKQHVSPGEVQAQHRGVFGGEIGEQEGLALEGGGGRVGAVVLPSLLRHLRKVP